MTISFRVSVARKEYHCENCRTVIGVGDEYVRRFGSSDDAMRNPPPYMIRLCRNCDPHAVVYWHETHKLRRAEVEARVHSNSIRARLEQEG